MFTVEVRRGETVEEFGIKGIYTFSTDGKEFLVVRKYFSPHLYHHTHLPTKLSPTEGNQYAENKQKVLDSLQLYETTFRYNAHFFILESPFNLAAFITQTLSDVSSIENLPFARIERRLNRIFWNLEKL